MFSLRDNVKEQLFLSSDVQTARVVDKLLSFAAASEAEEIYLEPREKSLAAVFRIGGEARKTVILPKQSEKSVLEALKGMAGLRMPTDNLPGNGKFRKNFPGFKIIFSLAVYPASDGEKIVVSLKKEKFEILSLGRLGFSGRSAETVKRNLSASDGLVLVIGEDDLMRTDALYGFLNILNRPDLNLATVEKEIAADVPEINQSQLDPLSGFNSSLAMDSLRRQDADIIMISEINDKESAEAAFNLAGSGHFVLAGLESREIGAGLFFLKDLPASLPLFASSAKMAVTVGSAEKNCPYCLTKKKLSGEIKKKLEEMFSGNFLEKLRQEKLISENISHWEDFSFYESKGCLRCGYSGISGRIGVFEVLEITERVKEFIRGGHLFSVRGETEKQGNYLLEQDALIKAIGGLISIEEVFKV
jgi:type II secretory ATPase GspE/PulE/Tfp pilus assembly ATPase PilB-like protein